MGNKRKKRNEIKGEDHDLLKPIDILSLGSDEDDCFGKLFDLTAKECKSCGDSEFCQIVKGQGLNKERLEIETEQRFKDIEEAEEETNRKESDAMETLKEYKEQGLPRLKNIMRVARETNLSKDVLKQLYEQI